MHQPKTGRPLKPRLWRNVLLPQPPTNHHPLPQENKLPHQRRRIVCQGISNPRIPHHKGKCSSAIESCSEVEPSSAPTPRTQKEILEKEKVRHPLSLRFMMMIRISKLQVRRNGPKTCPQNSWPSGSTFLMKDTRIRSGLHER